MITQAYEAALEECLAGIVAHPEVDQANPGLSGWCYADPETTLMEIDTAVARNDAAEASRLEALYECLATVEAHPELLEIDPLLVDSCLDNPHFALVDIGLMFDEVNANTEGRGIDSPNSFATPADECAWWIENHPRLLEFDTYLMDSCLKNPEAALLDIEQYSAILDAEHTTVDHEVVLSECLALIDNHPEILDVDALVSDYCYENPELTVGYIEGLLYEAPV